MRASSKLLRLRSRVGYRRDPIRWPKVFTTAAPCRAMTALRQKPTHSPGQPQTSQQAPAISKEGNSQNRSNQTSSGNLVKSLIVDQSGCSTVANIQPQ